MKLLKGFRAMNVDKANEIRELGSKASALKRRVTPDLFWKRVNILTGGECWEWQGGRDSRGYGKVRINGKLMGAYRAAYIFTTGQEPGKLHVCHRCDNPPCCNPNHLFLATARENALDRTKKGRTTQCESHPFAKLTPTIVNQIRKEYRPFDRKRGCRALARKYGVSSGIVGGIIRGVRWKNKTSLSLSALPTEADNSDEIKQA